MTRLWTESRDVRRDLDKVGNRIIGMHLEPKKKLGWHRICASFSHA